ncbi:hypothetical protein Bca52824_019068 [Brassica carinata]|uniref:Uncharacterized protein n=1 Tax=Brassica carinata TaxID=52824 RepID=A0A8X7VQV2_BRACI|nr:hypothetical protein Bca52824_019068 [Brassica carinata]
MVVRQVHCFPNASADISTKLVHTDPKGSNHLGYFFTNVTSTPQQVLVITFAKHFQTGNAPGFHTWLARGNVQDRFSSLNFREEVYSEVALSLSLSLSPLLLTASRYLLSRSRREVMNTPDVLFRQNTPPFVGEAVIESAVGWLNAAQIESLLLAAEANLIPISTDPAPEGTTGLFVYNTRAYNDHRMYHHVGPTSLIARQTLVNGDSFVKMGEAIGFNNNRYRKRVHRNFDRFHHLAIIHYRFIGLHEL